jgi:4-hydroxy-3-methylbut-2-en-1-yl diphosphate reductase
VPTYHIADTAGLLSAAEIRHRPIGAPSTAAVAEAVTSGWLPEGDVVVGLTAGASTPNNIVGQVIERLEELVNGRPPALTT